MSELASTGTNELRSGTRVALALDNLLAFSVTGAAFAARREADSWIDVTAATFPRMLRIEVSDGGPTFRHDPTLPALDAACCQGPSRTAWGARRELSPTTRVTR